MSINWKKREMDGFRNEEHFYEDIKEIFSDKKDIQRNTNQYDLFDFTCDDAVWELKGRNIEYGKYNTALLGFNKVDSGFKLLEEGKQVFFLWSYTNGLYMWELTKENFNKIGGVQMITGAGCNKKWGTNLKTLEVPIKYLTQISSKGTFS